MFGFCEHFWAVRSCGLVGHQHGISLLFSAWILRPFEKRLLPRSALPTQSRDTEAISLQWASKEAHETGSP